MISSGSEHVEGGEASQELGAVGPHVLAPDVNEPAVRGGESSDEEQAQTSQGRITLQGRLGRAVGVGVADLDQQSLAGCNDTGSHGCSTVAQCVRGQFFHCQEESFAASIVHDDGFRVDELADVGSHEVQVGGCNQLLLSGGAAQSWRRMLCPGFVHHVVQLCAPSGEASRARRPGNQQPPRRDRRPCRVSGVGCRVSGVGFPGPDSSWASGAGRVAPARYDALKRQEIDESFRSPKDARA